MEHILLIEDNKDVRENTAEILELAGYKVSMAADGKKGVEQVNKEKPDLIICDIMMPVLDGYEVLHLISKNEVTANIPFIFLTAKAERSDLRKGMEMGADDYITKPFDKIELLNAVESRLKKIDSLKNEYKKDIEGITAFIGNVAGKDVNIREPLDFFSGQKQEFQKRLIVRFGEQIKVIEIDNIMYFFVENKITYLFTKTKLQYPVEHNLDELEKIIDPKIFFRINRQFIVNINSIEKMTNYSKSRVKLTLNPPATQETIVSAERSTEFKIWLLGKKP